MSRQASLGNQHVVGQSRSAHKPNDPSARLPGPDWPNREHSESVAAGGLQWHLQQAGTGPGMLLLHGTGSATHSWRDLLPMLAEDHTVLAPDLPGYGFTRAAGKESLSLPGMAQALNALLEAKSFSPEIVVGHSAGAAVLMQMVLQGYIAPRLVIGLNAALLPFGGPLAKAFQPLAKLCVNIPMLPTLVAARARQRGSIERLIANTGSNLSEQAVADYRRMLGDESRVASTLMMMASWDLGSVLQGMANASTPLVLIVGDADRTVPPSQAQRVRSYLPSTRIIHLPGLGHLAHEERPDLVSEAIRVCSTAEINNEP